MAVPDVASQWDGTILPVYQQEAERLQRQLVLDHGSGQVAIVTYPNRLRKAGVHQLMATTYSLHTPLNDGGAVTQDTPRTLCDITGDPSLGWTKGTHQSLVLVTADPERPRAGPEVDPSVSPEKVTPEKAEPGSFGESSGGLLSTIAGFLNFTDQQPDASTSSASVHLGTPPPGVGRCDKPAPNPADHGPLPPSALHGVVEVGGSHLVFWFPPEKGAVPSTCVLPGSGGPGSVADPLRALLSADISSRTASQTG